MRNVSNAFKERMNDRRDFYATAEITFADGTVKNLTKADFNIQGNSVIQGGATSSFPLGVLSSKQITLSLLNNDDKWEEYGFYNAQIKLATNYQTNEPDPESSDGFTPVIERLQEGIFTVITPETYGTTIEITAMDESYKTDKEYTSSIQFPARLDDALRDCCANCGITLYSDDIPNKDFIIKKKPEGISFRDFIGNCAMVAGGNAIMDNYNRLKIITYDFSVFSDQEQAARIPLLKDFKPGLRLEAIDVEITGLQITGEITETDEEGNETTTTETFKYGEDGYVLTLTNELAAGNEEAFLRSVGDIIVGSRFRAFSGDSIADPLIEFMDAVYIRDYKGRVFQSFISDIDFSYFGTTVIKCSADSPLRNGQSGGRDPVKHLKQLIEKEKTEREKALERLNQMLKDSSGIYTTAEEQPDGSVIMYIHNKPTIKESKYVIKITGEAMGISNDSGETYIYGLSYDGEAILRKIYAEGIDADYITTGHLSADRILGGTLELGGWNNENGVLKIIDENGDVIGTWDKDGITILKGKLSAALIVGGILTLGGLNNQHGVLNILDEEGELIGSWNKDGINALKGTFAGNITIGGTTDGVCTILNAESAEVARIDNNGVSTFGSDTYGENIARLYGGYLRFYRDNNAVGHVGTSYAAVGEDSELIPGVALFTNGSGQWIGLGHEGKIYFMYHAPDDEFKMYKDLNMNGHKVYNAVIEGTGEGTVSGGVGEFTNEDKNSEIFNSYKDVTNESGTVMYKKNYINPRTPFAHVGGLGNAIDRDASSISGLSAIVAGHHSEITNSPLSAIITGDEQKIDSSNLAAIICGRKNKISSSYFTGILGGDLNEILGHSTSSAIVAGTSNVCESAKSFIGGGTNNKIASSLFSAICGGKNNNISVNGTAAAFIGGGSNNEVNTNGFDSAIVGGNNNTVSAANSTILAGHGNSVNSTQYGTQSSAVICGNGNRVRGSDSVVICGGGNTVSSGCSAVIAGSGNENGGFGCVAMGSNNKITGQSSSVTLYTFVCGQENEVGGSQDCIVCGRGAKASEMHKIVVGNYTYGNVFWVDAFGNVYAHSFNIIDETASETSAFPAKSTNNPDISELLEQINQMKSDIETLKSKNEELRAEVEKLKQ